MSFFMSDVNSDGSGGAPGGSSISDSSTSNNKTSAATEKTKGSGANNDNSLSERLRTSDTKSGEADQAKKGDIKSSSGKSGRRPLTDAQREQRRIAKEEQQQFKNNVTFIAAELRKESSKNASATNNANVNATSVVVGGGDGGGTADGNIIDDSDSPSTPQNQVQTIPTNSVPPPPRIRGMARLENVLGKRTPTGRYPSLSLEYLQRAADIHSIKRARIYGSHTGTGSNNWTKYMGEDEE